MNNALSERCKDAGVGSSSVRIAATKAEEYLIAAQVIIDSSPHVPSGGADLLLTVAQLIATAELAGK